MAPFLVVVTACVLCYLHAKDRGWIVVAPSYAGKLKSMYDRVPSSHTV